MSRRDGTARDEVEIYEVGPRDGLQNEARLIPTAEKIALIDLLSSAGFRHVEATSFVSPAWVPQMADAAEVMAGIARNPGVTYAALVPNLKGFQRAMAAKVQEVAVFVSASEGFSRQNLNCSISESLARITPVCAAALDRKVQLRGYVSCVTDCPFDGPVPPGSVAKVTARLRDLGCGQVSLGDTIGRGTPDAVRAMLRAVLAEMPAARLAGHFHDTGGRALANIEAALDLGLRVFDAAVGGLGGCPFAPGASGNVASEAVAERLAALGLGTGLDRDVLRRAAEMARRMRHG